MEFTLPWRTTGQIANSQLSLDLTLSMFIEFKKTKKVATPFDLFLTTFGQPKVVKRLYVIYTNPITHSFHKFASTFGSVMNDSYIACNNNICI